MISTWDLQPSISKMIVLSKIFWAAVMVLIVKVYVHISKLAQISEPTLVSEPTQISETALISEPTLVSEPTQISETVQISEIAQISKPTEEPIFTETFKHRHKPKPKPKPTSKPIPTSQPIPTSKPIPTSNPNPTSIPNPTSNPIPTSTPIPTSEPLPTLEPIPTWKPEGLPIPIPQIHPDAHLNTPEIIQKYGYPVETHKVTTEDGYILTVFRIPYGRSKASQRNTKGVVFVQHCFLCSSDDWLVNFTNNTLPFLLADRGYDVWIGNSRGNTYSREHTDPLYNFYESNNKYWRFSWHEMGVYDIPASLDYVTSITKRENIYYVGHSMGTTMFFVCMTERPEYNKKIKLMIGLAPAAYVGNTTSPLLLPSPASQYQQILLEALGIGTLIPENIIKFLHTIGPLVCSVMAFCSPLLYFVVGYDPYNTATITTSNVVGHTPASTSTNTFFHFLTNHQSGCFCQLDYGLLGNLNKYNSPLPPKYDLSKITARTVFYNGGRDTLATPKDVRKAVSEMVNSQNEVIRIDVYNHLDFVYGTSVYTTVFKSLISKLERDVALFS